MSSSQGDKKGRNIAIAALIISALAFLFGTGVIPRVMEAMQRPAPPPLSLELISIGDIVVNAGNGYTNKWNFTLPVQLHLVTWSKSDLRVSNETFEANPAIKSILVQGMERKTSVSISKRLVKGVDADDRDVTLSIPLEIVAWVKGGHGSIFGETREKIGKFSFAINLVELSTNRTKSITLSKDVFWSRKGL